MRLLSCVALLLLTSTPTAANHVGTDSPHLAPGGFVRPLDGPVVRTFELGEYRYAPGHRGVDLAASDGSIVRAAGEGTVAAAGPVAGRPVVSIIHTGGLRTTYEPVTPWVRSGQHVATGQPIGVLLAGHVGCAGSACLHWGLRREGAGAEVYLDPLLLLGTGAVRLKPLKPGDAL